MFTALLILAILIGVYYYLEKSKGNYRKKRPKNEDNNIQIEVSLSETNDPPVQPINTSSLSPEILAGLPKEIQDSIIQSQSLPSSSNTHTIVTTSSSEATIYQFTGPDGKMQSFNSLDEMPEDIKAVFEGGLNMDDGFWENVASEENIHTSLFDLPNSDDQTNKTSTEIQNPKPTKKTADTPASPPTNTRRWNDGNDTVKLDPEAED